MAGDDVDVVVIGAGFAGPVIVQGRVILFHRLGNEEIVDAIFARDYPLVQGVIMLTATLFVLTNLLVDLTYTFLDPRIRYS